MPDRPENVGKLTKRQTLLLADIAYRINNLTHSFRIDTPEYISVLQIHKDLGLFLEAHGFKIKHNFPRNLTSVAKKKWRDAK